MSQRNPIGIASHLNFVSLSVASQQLDLMQAAGIHWVRLEMPWDSIEYASNAFAFSKYDTLVAGIRARGMEVLALLPQYFVPAWYSGSNPSNQPAAPSDFAAFVSAVAAHFKGLIPFYEVGNEPNMDANWYPHANATAYTALLQASYTAIKAADSNAQVISAGLAQVATYPDTFLTQMYAAGAQGYMDYVGHHPYCTTASPDAISTYGFNDLATLQSIMAANGDGGKQIIATEFGWSTYTGGVSEANQATYISRVYQKIMHENFQYVAIACVYDFVDDGTDKTNPQNNYGLLRTDYSKKPAYAAVQGVNGYSHEAWMGNIMWGIPSPLSASSGRRK